MGSHVTTTANFGRSGTHAFVVHDGGDSHISPVIKRTGVWEPMTTQIISALLRPGDHMLDVGANIGWYAVLGARLVGETGRVVAYEPDPLNFSLLVENTSGMRNVMACQAALADQPGSLELMQSAANLGDHRLSAKHDDLRRSSITVDVDNIDHLIQRGDLTLDKLRVIKIDTQGAETLIFRGAKETLNGLSAQCALVIEFAPNLLRQHGDDHIPELIMGLDALHRPMFMVRKRTLKAVTPSDLMDLAEKCRPFGEEIAVDVLCAPVSGQDLRDIRKAVRRVRFTRR